MSRYWRGATLAALCLVLPLAAIGDDPPERPSIGLALGSGGAGGLAHIRMIEVFEEMEIRPDAIAGTSIGAIIGMLYAAGMDTEGMRELFEEFGESALNPFSDNDSNIGLTDLLKIDFGNGSLLDSDGFFELVAERIEARSFADLELPLKVVATNYWDGETVVMEEGDLFEAVKASMAVPGLFAPVPRDERLLIDGGTSNPLPWDTIADHDRVIAIDVTGTRNPDEDESPDLGDLLFKTFEIMQQSMIAQMYRAAPPDIYIKPELSDVRLLHFDRVDEVLEQAAGAAEQLREQLDQALKE